MALVIEMASDTSEKSQFKCLAHIVSIDIKVSFSIDIKELAYSEGKGWEPECTNRLMKQRTDQGEKRCRKVKILEVAMCQKVLKKKQI